MRVTASVTEQAPVPGISFAAGTPAAIRRSSSSIRAPADIELASLVVPKTASPSALWSNSQRQNAINRPASGSPEGGKGVNTGTSTPAKDCDGIGRLPAG